MCAGANKAGELGYVESGSYGKSEIDIYEWPRRRLWFDKVRTEVSDYDSAKRNLVVLFIHFNALLRLLPASRASGRKLDAHA